MTNYWIFIFIFFGVIFALFISYLGVKILLAFIGWRRMLKMQRSDKSVAKRTEKKYKKPPTNREDKRERKKPTLEKLNDPVQELENEAQNVKIVGVRKPIGFWTKLVTSQIMNQFDLNVFDPKQGFWVNFIKSQEAGKGKGRRDR